MEKKLKNAIQKMPAVKMVATRSIAMGMLSTTTGSSGVQINGILPSVENSVSQLNKKIRIGKSLDVKNKKEILIGKKLAKKMKLSIGNKLVLTFTDNENSIVASAFKIVGIFESDNAPLDERTVYVNKHFFNELLGLGTQFHEIVIILHDDKLLEKVQSDLQNKYTHVQIDNWKTLSPETELMVNTVDITSYIIMGIILFALAFGIINTMLMAILERTKEIGMMMALGMNKFKMFLLILLETSFLTIAGTPFGIFLAWCVTSYYHQHGLNWAQMSKEMMSSFGFSTTIYLDFPTEKLAVTILFVLTTSVLSCLYPALKALQLKPVEALRK